MEKQITIYKVAGGFGSSVKTQQQMIDNEMGDQYVGGIVDESGLLSDAQKAEVLAYQQRLDDAVAAATGDARLKARYRLEDAAEAARVLAVVTKEGKKMAAKFAGNCAATGKAINVGDQMIYCRGKAYIA